MGTATKVWLAVCWVGIGLEGLWFCVVPLAMTGTIGLKDLSSILKLGLIFALWIGLVYGARTWQAAASAGMSIGQDGMVIASKALALTAVDLFLNPGLVTRTQQDFHHQLEGKTYESAIPPNQKPLIDYRDLQRQRLATVGNADGGNQYAIPSAFASRYPKALALGL